MEDVKIFRSSEIDPLPLIGFKGTEEGWMKRVIYPQNVATKGVFFGVAEVNPGHSPHRWHNHVADKAEGYEVVYPENFEEIYYIVSGTGVVQWSTEDEKIKEEKVTAGDVVFFPAGVAMEVILHERAKL
jgi:uncharacterized cupin superfamily protein